MGFLDDQLSIGFALGSSARLSILPPDDQHQADQLKHAVQAVQRLLSSGAGNMPYKKKASGGYERSAYEEAANRRRMERQSDRAFRSNQKWALDRQAWEIRYTEKRQFVERAMSETRKAEDSFASRERSAESRLGRAWEFEQKVSRFERFAKYARTAAKWAVIK